MITFDDKVNKQITPNCSPKRMFIMGGGEGSAVREAIKHKLIEKMIMCDIDEVNLLLLHTQKTTGWWNQRRASLG